MTVCEAWEKAGVRWCVLRDGAGGPSAELDVLVDRRDWSRAEAALRAAGWVPLPTWGRGSHRFFLRYDPATDTWAKLDAVTELAFGSYQEFRVPGAAAECLGRAARGRLDPGDEFWALLLHAVLDRPQPSERQRKDLARLAVHATVEGTLARWVGLACPPGEIIAAARAGDRDALGVRLRTGLPRTHRAVARLRAARNRLVRNVSRPIARLRRRALSVALLAPDGAGKSTLQRALAAAWPLETWTAYLGLYPPSARGSLAVTRFARFWRRYAAGRLWQARGRLVIYDRHPIETLILKDAPASGASRRLQRSVIARACPLPDLVLVLDAPGALLHARKPERSPAELDAQRARYARTPGAVLIDASGDPDTVRRHATRAIWDSWSARAVTNRG